MLTRAQEIEVSMIHMERICEPIDAEKSALGPCYVDGCAEPVRYWVGYRWGEGSVLGNMSAMQSCKFHADEG